jgi:hypothetical protein
LKKYILYSFVLLLVAHANAQTVHSDIALMDYERLAQLQDSVNAPTRSFVIRSASQFWSNTLNKPFSAKSKATAQLVQVGYTLQSNNNLPIGYNEGNFYPAVGLQQRFTIGAHFQWQGFSLQLQPEFINAANADPVNFTSDPADGNYWAKYYLYNVNKIDNFDRFGTVPISKVFAGQSSLRFNTNNISFGISAENLWWGPGIRNSLVLTNNAPGFLHFTFNSRKPIPTKWGNIEFQTVVGKLKNTDTEAPDNALMRTMWADGIAKKPQENRTMLGYIFSWNPKWTPNLHIGLTGANYFYSTVVTPTPSVLITAAENKSGSASLGAVFFRYVMPKEQAEVYVEYGRANKLVTPFNIFGDTIPTGYTAGFRKLFLSSSPGQGRSPLGGRGRSSARGGILLSVEITQLQLPDSRLIFNKENVFGIPKTNSWYTHPFVSHGYTNNGQVMGASIGPGSNSQTVNISWVKGLKRIGVQAERLAHNNDFYYYNYFSGIIGTGQANKYWVDWNVGLQFQWDIKNLLVSGFYNHTSALNYRWTKLDGGFAGPSDLSDKTNKQFSLSLTYFFTQSPPSRRGVTK